MKENRKYSTVEIIAVVCCAIGCLLFVAPRFIDTEFNLFMLGLAFNGVGISAFLYSTGSKKPISKLDLCHGVLLVGESIASSFYQKEFFRNKL